VTDQGFKIITFQEFKKMKISQMKPKPVIVFVNRRTAFKPNKDVLARYDDFMRKYTGNPRQHQFSMEGSHYDANYRRRIIRDGESIRELRKLAVKSKAESIYMVKDKPRPDAEILVDIAEQMLGADVWK